MLKLIQFVSLLKIALAFPAQYVEKRSFNPFTKSIPVPKVGFKFEIDCTYLSPSTCKQAKYSILTRIAVISAGNRIANEILFKRFINVKVVFKLLPIASAQTTTSLIYRNDN